MILASPHRTGPLARVSTTLLAVACAVACVAGSGLFASCYLDTSGLTAHAAATDGGGASVDASPDADPREAGCSGVDAAVCEDFDRPSALDAWSPLHLTNGGELVIDSTASVSAPNALRARTPAQGPTPRTANVTRTVTLSNAGLALEVDLLVDAGCATSLAVVSDDLASPYYQLGLVAERGQPFRVVENHDNSTSRHDGTLGLTGAWSHVRCEMRFAPAVVDCFVDGQHVLDRVPVTPTRPLSGRNVHVGIGINYDDTSAGCSARLDNFILTTW